MADEDKVESIEKARRARGRVKMTRPGDAEMAALKPGENFLGVEPGGWREKADRYGLPPHCPVRPLGRIGDTFFVFNVFGGVAELGPKSGRGDIEALFSGAKYYPCWAWPKKGKRGSEDFNFNVDLARADLFEACTIKQREMQINVRDAVRGRGCWPGPDGGLYVHFGNGLLTPEGREVEPHATDDFVYPVRPPIDRPAGGAAPAGVDGPGRRLLAKFATWNWMRADIDPVLLLGWVGSAFLGPALFWRPPCFLTGDRGTGKSQLMALIKASLQRWAILTTNSTAPSIYRELNCDGLAVMNDEAEGKRDNRRAMAVIELAREAASGSMTMRAGGDGAEKFTVRSAFLFSAINMPPLEPADYSRMALLHLRPFEKPGDSPIDEREDALAGAEILRRLIERYDDVVANVKAFRAALIAAGHDGRGGDTFGVLIGVAWTILEDGGAGEDDLAEWAAMLAPEKMVELEGSRANWEGCLDQLLTATPEVWRQNAAKSVGAFLARWAENREATLELREVKERLAQVGLGLTFAGGQQNFGAAWLFVPSAHPATRVLFAGTKWGGEAGAPGTWATALRGAPDHVIRRDAVKGVIAGRKYSGVAIRLAQVIEIEKPDGEGRQDG